MDIVRLKTCLKLLIAMVFCMTRVVGLSAQGEYGIIAGISNYQGELASYSTQNGFKALIGPVIGVHGAYEWNPIIHFRSSLIYTRLKGDDALAEKENTRSRNLHFFAPLVQLSVGADIHVPGFSPSKDKLFSPYLTIGGGVFYYAPKTKYQGQNVALHPLGTEGQYLDDFPDQRPYSLIQPVVNVGGGLKFFLAEKYIVALEAAFHFTFTDYLDDVSSIYISYPEMLEKAGPLTASLVNRNHELTGGEPLVINTGSLRGNPNNNDLFGTITARLTLPFEITSSRFKVRLHQNKSMKCPKF